MLRAVIESNEKRAYLDFCGPWDKFEKAIRKLSSVEYVSQLKVRNSDFQFHISKFSGEVFDKLDLLINSNDSIYDIYFICKKLQYDDIDFKTKFITDETCSSITDVRKMFIEYSHMKHNEKSNAEEFSRVKNPNELVYEPFKLFGQKVLFTEWRIDINYLPKGLYRYEVREDGGDITGIAKGIMFNHYGTIISDKPIKLDNDEYKSIDESKDIIYSEEPGVTLNQYIHESKIMNKQFQQR